MSAWRRRIRLWGFCAYGAATLIGMAPMNIGFALLLIGTVAGAGGLRGFWADLTETLRAPWVRRFFWISMAFVVVCGASLVWARVHPLVYNGEIHAVRFPGDFVKMWYWFHPFVVLTGLRKMDQADRRRVVECWLISMGAFSLVGIQQFFTGWPYANRIPELRNHYNATSFLGHHLSFSNVFVFPFFAALDLAARKTKDREKWFSLPGWVLWLLTGLGGLALFLTFSRILWAAIPVAVLLWGFVALRKRGRVALVLVVGLLMGAAALSPVVRAHLGKGADMDRVQLWEANWHFFLDSPLLGAGFKVNHQICLQWLREHHPGRTWYFMGHAHNDVLDVLGGMGALGLLTWLLWMGWIFAAHRGPIQDRGLGRSFAQGLLCAWVAFHINGLTQVNYLEGKVQHQMMWAVAWVMLMVWLKGESRGKKT
ncbi:MAG TPA: O-antigen ligase family protein [Bdellovibrionota bacterium]|nr:O-antigen ligase family protein [Bdellovibrionota bacterium]